VTYATTPCEAARHIASGMVTHVRAPPLSLTASVMPTPSSVLPAPAAMLIVAGPSCVGKDTVVTRLLAARPELAKPVTTTTRPPRRIADGATLDEIEGTHYYFLTPGEFLTGVADGAFLEHANVHGKYYGLSRRALDDVRAREQLPAVILDVQGVASVRSLVPIVSVFVTAPIDQIEARMRATRPAAEIAPRMASIAQELAHASTYDLVLDNGDGRLESAVAELLSFYDTIARPRLTASKVPASPVVSTAKRIAR
jgi:guanylate kinase